jgi:tryptophanyl-tRNA synthetase
LLQDDAELAQIYKDYKKGTMATSEIKKKCADELSSFVTAFQARRAKVTEEILDEFMRPRPLQVHGQLSTSIVPLVGGKGAAKPGDVADPNSKSQAKKAEKMRLAEAKKAQKAKESEEKAKAAAAKTASAGTGSAA